MSLIILQKETNPQSVLALLKLLKPGMPSIFHSRPTSIAMLWLSEKLGGWGCGVGLALRGGLEGLFGEGESAG